MSERDPFDSIGLDSGLLGEMRKARRRIRSLARKNVRANALDELANDGGSQGPTDFQSMLVDDEGVHTSADVVDINVFYPVTSASDLISNIVYSMAHDVNNNCLYFGGSFSKTNGKVGGVLANGIVKFNLLTLEFSPLIDSGGTNGVSGTVYAITVDSGGNVFFLANNIGTVTFYKWDPGTTTFTAISPPATYAFDHHVISCDSNDDIYLVRYLTSGILVGHRWLAKYNGSSFADVAAYGNTKKIYALHVDANDNVFFGGDETTIASVTDRTWVYDQSSVAGLGDAFDAEVRALWKDPNTDIIYAGGDMTGYLHTLSGTTWEQVGELDGAVRAVAGANGLIYIGGDMTDYAKVWDGESMARAGNGSLNDTVHTLLAVGKDIWFGGAFDEFNGRPARAVGILIRNLASALNFLAPRYVPIQSNGDISLDGSTIADLLKLDASENTLTLANLRFSNTPIGGGISTGTIGDDGVYSFTPPATTGILIALRDANLSSSNAEEYLVGFYNTATGTIYYSMIGSQTTIASGALTGTTGTDGKFNVSAHTDGKIYLENRRGAGRRWRVQIIGTVLA